MEPNSEFWRSRSLASLVAEVPILQAFYILLIDGLENCTMNNDKQIDFNHYEVCAASLELDCLSNSLGGWIPFSDMVEALQALKKRFRLAIISNVDDDLIGLSAKHLKVPFDWVITAEQVKAYKPSLQNFEFTIDRISMPPEKILHIAQSICHDIIPAKAMGLSTVWINRRKGQSGLGATPPANATPDLEVPDLKTLVSIIG